MRTYEVMTIHRPDLGEDDVESRVNGIAEFLTQRGATISGRDLWGKRRFAYEIGDLHDGYYSVVTFQAEPSAINDLQRMLTLADEVVRHKIIQPGQPKAAPTPPAEEPQAAPSPPAEEPQAAPPPPAAESEERTP